MLLLEDGEEGKLELEQTISQKVKSSPWKNTGTGLKILTSNKLLTRLPILLEQFKDGNNSYKLKN